MKVAVIAFGTRGDVQPLAILAVGLVSRCTWCSQVVLVSHKQHSALVRSVLDVSVHPHHSATFAAVDSPLVIWKGLSGSDAAEERANRLQQDACVEACQGAGLIIFNMFALEGYHVAENMQVPCVVCHPYLTATPIPSSFRARIRRAHPLLFRRLTRLPATENPLLSPRGPDKGSSDGAQPTAKLSPKPARQHPASPSQGARDDDRAEPSCRKSSTSYGTAAKSAWAHVEHWMWPLFTDRWGPFRERLGLHPCPFLDSRTTVANNMGESHSQAGVGSALSFRAINPAQLPMVLYLFSSLVVDMSPFWPESVRACGYLYPCSKSTIPATCGREEIGRAGIRLGRPSLPTEQQHRSPSTPPEKADDSVVRDIEATAPETWPRLPVNVETFLSAREDRPIFVSFGSMWGMCPLGYRLAFALQAVLIGARQAGQRCLVFLPTAEAIGGGGEGFAGVNETNENHLSELSSAGDFVLGATAASKGQDNLLVHRGNPLDHEALLPRCSLAVHHGGSGTTAAVLKAGIPHVICPQQLDQFFWAERVGYLGAGSVLERSLFMGHGPSATTPPASVICRAASAILSALTPQVKLRAACLGVKIRAEKGLENALDALTTFLRDSQGERRRPASSSPNTPLQPPISVDTTTVSPDTVKAPRSEGRPTAGGGSFPQSPRVHGRVDEGGEGRPSAGKIFDKPPRGFGGDSGGVATSECDVEDKLMLREMPNGLQVWCGSRAEEEAFFIYGEIFEDRTYARRGIRVEDGDTIWDVGANVGLASIFFELETDEPDSLRVYAFEPIPLNSIALKRNLAAHCPTAVVLEYALGATNSDGAVATFFPRMPGNSTLRHSEKERLQGRMRRSPASEPSSFEGALKGGVPVDGATGGFFDDAEEVGCNVRTVSWAMESLRVDKIDLLKVDVEGAELDVLLGVEERDWPKIGQVVAEVHPMGDRVATVCKLLRDHGFDVSVQALGLDGTPISPGRDTPGAGAGNKGAAMPRSSDAGPPWLAARQSPLGQGFDDTGGKDQPGNHEGRGSSEGHGASAWSSGGCGDGTDGGTIAYAAADYSRQYCGRDEAVLDGVVFMVYATRLKCY